MFIIAGLGNPTLQYEGTRHNVGFDVIDMLADRYNISVDGRKGRALVGKGIIEGQKVLLVKPQTYMNLSGKAVGYWLKTEKIPIENLFVVVDDIALPFGTLRIRGKGSDGGHNGLKNISELLGTEEYARMRFGVGGDFPKGHQVDYVLGEWSEEDRKAMPERLKVFCDAILSFATIGVERTMNFFNKK